MTDPQVQGLLDESVISLGETCSCPLNLRLKPHHQWSLCTEQQEGLRHGEHYRRVEGERRPKEGNFRWPLCRLQGERAATRNNRILRPNVVTRRVSMERTGVVPHQRGVRPNNNNNSQVALEALFQPNTLHELWQLGLCTKMNTPDTEHQLDAEVVVAEVAYTMTNTQPSCSGGGESDRILNTFKEAMDLLQAARLKEALDKDIASLENHVAFGLSPRDTRLLVSSGFQN